MSGRERDIVNPTGENRESRPVKRWRSEFPYHWDLDELVSRREFFHLAVYASGALFGCTALLAVLGLRRRTAETKAERIGQVADFPVGEAHYFHYPGEEDEAMLIHLPDNRFVAYSQKCTHLSCAVYYQPDHHRIFCPCHDGVFDPRTGNPIAGPPQRRLPQILLRQQGNDLYAVGEEA